jgi:hypothetical protein
MKEYYFLHSYQRTRCTSDLKNIAFHCYRIVLFVSGSYTSRKAIPFNYGRMCKDLLGRVADQAPRSTAMQSSQTLKSLIPAKPNGWPDQLIRTKDTRDAIIKTLEPM